MARLCRPITSSNSAEGVAGANAPVPTIVLAKGIGRGSVPPVDMEQ